MMTRVGWYSSADADAPAHDPGLLVLCPLCGQRLIDEAPRRTISLMPWPDDRSYFYRVHQRCYDAADPIVVKRIEDDIIDSAVPNNSGG